MFAFLAMLLIISIQVANAQKRTISGRVTAKDDGKSIPGVNVSVVGTTVGTVTDIDGKYQISVPEGKKKLMFSFIGMKKQEVILTESNSFDVVLESDIMRMDEVVVTALGITREKKSLGYSTQEIKGDNVSTVKSDNFMNSLSGKVSGVQIKKTTNMGGSTNVILRGSKSLTGDNQVLYVIDGVPVSNDITNTTSQKQAGIGYDYGNAASDINPDDIESVNVLKGSAATALYGSRAAGGVVMITTKKGNSSKLGTTKKGIGVTFNSGITMGFLDKSTMPTYQNQYGAGYGDYWTYSDINGDGVDEQCSNMIDDASYGPKFDPTLLVYQWDAVDPKSPNYMKATPWVAAKNGPNTFFEKPLTLNNSISIDNSFDLGSYRLSYTNYKQNGLMPNSELKKDNVLLNGSWKVTDKLVATGSANYSKQKGKGRNSTGYSDNIMGSFRQWMETNVDIQDQKDMYDNNLRNVTWNYADPTDPQPIYWDNYYWTRYENYETDSRNRFIGNIALNYQVNDWFDVYGRASTDTYSQLEEERRAVGSIPTPFGIGTSGADGSGTRSDQGSGYLRRDISFSETNYDLMLNFHKDLSKALNLKGVIGSNTRRTNYDRLISSTSGGLVIPGLYSLQNSADPLPYSKELSSKIGVNGLYASADLGYKNLAYLSGTIRRDHSSTLPVDNAVYYYPSIAGSLIFSNLLTKYEWLSFGKVRLNYAMVGNSPGFDQLTDNYTFLTAYNSTITAANSTKKNPELKPEKTNSLEGGLEMFFFGRRVGFDLALYKTNSTDQIMPLAISSSTGYAYKMINAGEIQNSGVELALMLTPVKKGKFKWDVNIMWAKNTNKVLSLIEGVDNLQLGTFQGGVTINARVGEAYGVICGTDYVYLHPDNPIASERIIDETTGAYLQTSTSDNVIGNVNPDWNGGITNTLTYKNWAFSFLIDMQKGGDIFSLDMYYGMSTGLYDETAYINDLGNPVRNPVYNTTSDPSSGLIPGNATGGYINEGVYADGTVNTTRYEAYDYTGFGYAANLPNAAFVYDATYVKLREISLSYTLPSTMFTKCFFTGATLSVVGSNVWTIFKNIPYVDPESGLGAGNLQGYTTGSLPSTRDFGFNLKLNF